MLLSGLTPELLRAGAWIFLFGAVIASCFLPWRWALAVSAVKVAIPLAYFAANTSGIVHVSDDLDYLYGGLRLVQMGYDPVSIFTTPLGLPALAGISGGWQVGYYFWNLLSVWLFGPHYFAPVLLNVGLTFVAGWLFFRILREMEFASDYSAYAAVFFLLHWDVVTWSSLLNLKDILVLTLTMAATYCALRIFRKVTLIPLLVLSLALGALLFLRFYIPVLFLNTLAAYLIFFRRKAGWLTVGTYIGLGLAVLIVLSTNERLSFARFQPGDIFLGIPHFLLTPLPWNPELGYQFLYLSAWLWLVFLPASLLMMPILWSRHPHAKFILLYVVFLVLLYAMIPIVRGPRHRVQVSFIFIWMQFHALWMLFQYATARSAPGSSAPAESPTGPGIS